MLLPPVIQEFRVDSAAFIASVNAMVGVTDRLAASIDAVTGSTDRLSGAAATTAAADDRLTGASTVAAEAVAAQGKAIDELIIASDGLAGAVDVVTAAIERENVVLDENIASSRKTDEQAGLLATHGKTAFLAVAAALGYSVVKAAEFQTQVTRLYTAAGLTQAAYGKVSQALLQIGDATGQTGTAIAEAMYHPVSAGLSLAAALKVVAYSAQLAAIHGANLDDTTYALSSVMKAYGVTAAGVGKTSALLNAIVGQGDMRFQDFVQSVKNWTPTGAAMGISIRSMGAALAYLTDRGNSAEVASTRMTMGLSMVTSGSKQANEYLSSLGLTTGSLTLKNKTLQQVMLAAGLTTNKVAADLKKPDGIYVALTHIQDAFRKAGLSASQADEVMAKIFGGGRSDKAMLSLMSNLDNLRAKYIKIGGAVSGYGASWKKTEETVSFQWHKALAGLENLATSFGLLVLPAVTKVLTAVGKFFQMLEQHPLVAKLVGALAALAVTTVVAAGAIAALSGVMGAIVPAAIIAGVIALAVGLYELYHHSKMVRDAVADVARFFKSAWADAVRAAGAVVNWFVSGPLAWIKAQVKVFSRFWAENGAEIEKITGAVWSAIAAFVKTSWDILWGVLRVGLVVMVTTWKITWDVVSTTVRTVWDVIVTVVTASIRMVLDVITVVLQLLQGHWSKAWDALKDLAATALHEAITVIKTIASGFLSLLYSAGRDLIQGLVNGIHSMIGAVGRAASDVAHGAVSVVKHVLGIFSPSKVMHEIGLEVGRGLILGLEGSASQVRSAAGKLASLVHQAFTGGLVSYARASQLTDFIQRDNTRLQDLATRRANILKTIAAAEKYAKSTTQSVESWAGLANTQSVANAASGGGLYAGDMLADMQRQLATIRKFEAALRRLAKLGLDKNLLNQIIQMGPQQGLQVAEALLDGPVSVIKAMDRTQAQINKAAGQLGKQAADEMYDSGKMAGRGFLSGLEGQQKAIEAMMKRIAEAMVRTIRRELGIHSPSAVMHEHGLMAALGLAEGLDSGRLQITAAAKRAAQALATGTHTAGGGGGAVINHYHYFQPKIEMNGVMATDKREIQAALWPLMMQAYLQWLKRNGAGGSGLSLASGRFG